MEKSQELGRQGTLEHQKPNETARGDTATGDASAESRASSADKAAANTCQTPVTRGAQQTGLEGTPAPAPLPSGATTPDQADPVGGAQTDLP